MNASSSWIRAARARRARGAPPTAPTSVAPPVTLADFARAAWPLVCPVPLVEELPQRAIVQHLQAFADRDERLSDTLVINVPPGQSKSLLCSVIYPAWLWTRDPSLTVITVSHTSALTQRFAARFRILITSEWYRARWPGTELSRDTTAKLAMRTTRLGERIGVSVGGSVTGNHADVIVVDDLVDARDAANGPAIEAANDWHEQVLMSRWKSEERRREICIAQRLHVTDLPAVLAARGASVLCLPAEGPGPASPLGPDTRAPGELLAPVRLSAKVLADKRLQLGSVGYAAQYQQTPVPAGGGLVQAAWLAHEYQGVAPTGEVTIVVDTSHGQDDPTGMLVVSRVAARLYLLDYLTGRWDFPEQLRRIEAAIARYRPIAVRVEAAASGHSVVQTLRARLPYVTGVVPHGSKDVRLSAVTPMLEAGSVLFPSGAPWVRAFRDEVLAFPRGAHDECVDTLSMACGLLARPGLESTSAATVANLISLLG